MILFPLNLVLVVGLAAESKVSSGNRWNYAPSGWAWT